MKRTCLRGHGSCSRPARAHAVNEPQWRWRRFYVRCPVVWSRRLRRSRDRAQLRLPRECARRHMLVCRSSSIRTVYLSRRSFRTRLIPACALVRRQRPMPLSSRSSVRLRLLRAGTISAVDRRAAALAICGRGLLGAALLLNGRRAWSGLTLTLYLNWPYRSAYSDPSSTFPRPILSVKQRSATSPSDQIAAMTILRAELPRTSETAMTSHRHASPAVSRIGPAVSPPFGFGAKAPRRGG